MTLDVSAAQRIAGWMSAAELEWLASSANGCFRIVEIGCWKGRSTKALAAHTPGVVYAVDHWQGSEGDPETQAEVAARGTDGVHAEFVENLGPELSAGKVIVIRAGTSEALPVLRQLLDGHKVDMVFIDGDHSSGAVRQDIEMYRPLLRDGGLLAGHDYCTVWPGVMEAVDQLAPARSVVQGGSIWYTRVPDRNVAGRAISPILDLEQLAVRRLEREGDDFRSQGRLDEARRAFEALLSMAPNHVKAERVLASLSGRATTAPRLSGCEAAPFVRVPDFLPPAQHDRLLEGLFNAAHHFETAHVGRLDEHGEERREIDQAYRRSAFLLNCFRYFDAGIWRGFRRRLAARFATITSNLQIPLIECRPREMRALLYRDGDFFRAHRDSGLHDVRRITFVYYMFESPRRFTGGDLVLYDTRVGAEGSQSRGLGFMPSAWTRIPCVDNQLVCFPSECFHAALPVAGVGDDIRGARIAVSGWFHEADGAARSNRSAPPP